MMPSRLSRARSRWWPAAIVVIVLLVAAAALSSQLGSDGRAEEAPQDGAAEPGQDDPAANSNDAAPDVTGTPDALLGDTTAPTEPHATTTGDGSNDGGGTQSADRELDAESPHIFGEPEHPVSGVEPYVPSRVRLDEPGPPAEVCQGTLPARRVQLPLRFASTKPEGVDHLSWSPDCRRMVFRVGSTLWIANGDGTSDQPFLTAQHGLSAPSWSPDSQWIAFAQNAIVDGERSSHIYTVRPDALGLSQITDGLVFDQDPTWSPDGTRIAFSRRVHVVGGDNADGFDQHIVLVEIETGNEQALVVGGEHESVPSWSPDGELIAYRAADSLRLLRLADAAVSKWRLDGISETATWSPDGKRLAILYRKPLFGRRVIVAESAALRDLAVEVELMGQSPQGFEPVLQWTSDSRRLLFHVAESRTASWAYNVDPPLANHSADFRLMLAAVAAAFEESGYRWLLGDNSVSDQIAFVATFGYDNLEVSLAFDRSRPSRTHEAIENPHSDLSAISRSLGGAGVWFVCGRLYGEVVAGQQQESDALLRADALGTVIRSAACPHG